MRIDKFLWAVRLYKTRRLASEACNTNQVKLNDGIAKQSRTVACGVQVTVKCAPIWRSYMVLDIPKSRIGAKLLPEYIEEITSEEDLNKLELVHLANRHSRLEGRKGRPTKKDRRNLDGWKG